MDAKLFATARPVARDALVRARTSDAVWFMVAARKKIKAVGEMWRKMFNTTRKEQGFTVSLGHLCRSPIGSFTTRPTL